MCPCQQSGLCDSVGNIRAVFCCLLSSLYFSAQFLFLVCSLQHTDMPEEMRVEAMELCVTACEKYATNNEV